MSNPLEASYGKWVHSFKMRGQTVNVYYMKRGTESLGHGRRKKLPDYITFRRVEDDGTEVTILEVRDKQFHSLTQALLWSSWGAKTGGAA